jgi:hypothetical protein
MKREGGGRPRTRLDLEREIWQTPHGGRRAFLERWEAVLKPMVGGLNAGLDPEPDDLDRFVGLTLFFEAALLVREWSTPKHLSEISEEEIKHLALCLGLEANWSTQTNDDGHNHRMKVEE